MEVFLANEQELQVDESRLTSLASHALAAEGLEDESELSILLVGKDHIQQLNARFAGEDHATDVLAFPMMDDDEEGSLLLGDVVVCPEIAQDNARRLNHGLLEELEVLLVHGILHLLGHDHQGVDDKVKMDKRLGEILSSFHSTAVR